MKPSTDWPMGERDTAHFKALDKKTPLKPFFLFQNKGSYRNKTHFSSFTMPRGLGLLLPLLKIIFPPSGLLLPFILVSPSEKWPRSPVLGSVTSSDLSTLICTSTCLSHWPVFHTWAFLRRALTAVWCYCDTSLVLSLLWVFVLFKLGLQCLDTYPVSEWSTAEWI